MQKGLDVLAPDSGAGRFVESLNEATQRIERDKTDYFPVIISVATTSGDRDVRDSDVERMMKRLEARPDHRPRHPLQRRHDVDERRRQPDQHRA